MKKLNLHLEDLSVESFETAAPDEIRGTVRGHNDSTGCSYDSPNYTGCRLSCAYDCGASAECTPECPGGGTGPGGGGGTYDNSCDTGCRLSCAYPC